METAISSGTKKHVALNTLAFVLIAVLLAAAATFYDGVPFGRVFVPTGQPASASPIGV